MNIRNPKPLSTEQQTEILGAALDKVKELMQMPTIGRGDRVLQIKLTHDGHVITRLAIEPPQIDNGRRIGV